LIPFLASGSLSFNTGVVHLHSGEPLGSRGFAGWTFTTFFGVDLGQILTLRMREMLDRGQGRDLDPIFTGRLDEKDIFYL
jgi:hypothetical protein